MSIKADLRVALYAGEVLVAESIDPILWQRNFSVMSGSSNEFLEENAFSREHHSDSQKRENAAASSKSPNSLDNYVIKFDTVAQLLNSA